MKKKLDCLVQREETENESERQNAKMGRRENDGGMEWSGKLGERETGETEKRKSEKTRKRNTLLVF
jgi:hypothetical protein